MTASAGWLAERPPPDRLYFGVAFCQHLLPEPQDVVAAAELARSRGWGLSLLSPYVTDAFVPRWTALVEAALQADAPELELVLEDWGLLRLARERFAGLPRVLGRGLDRAMRDPRLPDVGPEHLGGDPPPSSWRATSASSSAFRALMVELGVQRLETDFPLQGLDPAPPDGPALSLWLPFGLVATGRLCLVNAWGKPAALRFVPPRSCDAPCRAFRVELRAPWSARDADAGSLPLVPEGAFLPLDALLNRRRNRLPDPAKDPAPRFLLKGNTHFYELREERLRAALDWAEASAAVDRLVVQPGLPL
jgi:hypothetical protein